MKKPPAAQWSSRMMSTYTIRYQHGYTAAVPRLIWDEVDMTAISILPGSITPSPDISETNYITQVPWYRGTPAGVPGR
jgi:hypothetical protein